MRWSGRWKKKKKNPLGCTPPLFIHLFELHMSAGTAGNRPRPQAGVVGLGLSQLAVQMAADLSQHKQEVGKGGGFREWKKGHCWNFLCKDFKSVKWLLEPCIQNIFSTISSWMQNVVEVWVSVSNMKCKRFYFILTWDHIFQSCPKHGQITVSLIEFIKITPQNMQIATRCWKQRLHATNYKH